MTIEFSEELKALLTEKGIAPERPQPSAEAQRWEELRDTYDKARSDANWSRSLASFYSSETDEEASEALLSNIENASDQIARSQAFLKATQALSEALAQGFREKSNDHDKEVYAWRRQLAEVLNQADGVHSVHYGTLEQRFTKALSQIKKIGVIVKKSQRSIYDLAEGVPLMFTNSAWGVWEDRAPSSLWFHTRNLFQENELNSTGKRIAEIFAENHLVTATDKTLLGVIFSGSRASSKSDIYRELETYLDNYWR